MRRVAPIRLPIAPLFTPDPIVNMVNLLTVDKPTRLHVDLILLFYLNHVSFHLGMITVNNNKTISFCTYQVMTNFFQNL